MLRIKDNLANGRTHFHGVGRLLSSRFDHRSILVGRNVYHVGGRTGDLLDDLITHEGGDGVDTLPRTAVSGGRLGDGPEEAWKGN